MVQTLSGNDRLWRRRTGEDVLNREASADRKGSLLTCRRCAVSAIHGSRLTIRRFPWSCSLVTFPAPRSMPLARSEEHTSELQSRFDLVCRLLLAKKTDTRYSTEHIAD